MTASKPVDKLDRKSLETRLDKMVQTYARYKWSYKKDDGMRYAHCVTCGREFPLNKGLAGGHFIPRGIKITRWDVDNVNPQCTGCNTYKNGAYIEYSSWVIDKYGKNWFDHMVSLMLQWRNNEIRNWKIDELRSKYRDTVELVRDFEESSGEKLIPKNW